MDSEIRRLFHELADVSPADRRRIMADRRVRPDTWAEVESLLMHDERDAGELSSCVAGIAGDLLDCAAAGNAVFCGPYRLIRLLGRGGMGSVFLAERTDGEIQQKVAVKLLAGGGRPEWRNRFLAERQLLASINHPAIVRVIDAGHTGEGRPFLVMEYIDGVPINEYASAVPVRERLQLFLRVCDAVAYAHQRLIVHRDLKPSNILVDAAGTPKLLDFGIAKLLDGSSPVTRTEDSLLTPDYASPEQLAGSVQTTATDIYSLGAILYNLLTGRSPSEGLRGAAHGGHDALPPSQFNPEVPRDIDSIVRKALREEQAERYASAEALAGDVRAVIEFRPVSARSGDTWYLARKFLRRHWRPAFAAALAAGGLTAGLLVANRERLVSERRFRQLQQLSTREFDLERSIRNVPGSLEARQRLVSASLESLEDLASDASNDLDLARAAGEAYWRIARIQGVPVELNLGERGKAMVSLKKADTLMERVLQSRPADRRALLRSAAIAQDRMILSQEEHSYDDAGAYARKAADRVNALPRRPGATEAELSEAAGIYHNVGLAYLNMHQYQSAIVNARRLVELGRTTPSAHLRIAQGLSLLASALRDQGNLDVALESIDEARRIAEESSYSSATEQMVDLYGILLREGLILGEDGSVNLGRRFQAIEPLQKALDLVEAAARRDPNDSVSRSRVGTSGRELGNILRYSDPRRALAAYDLGLFRVSQIPVNRKTMRDRAVLLASSSYALSSLHRPDEAHARIEEALRLLRTAGDYPSERTAIGGEAVAVLSADADHAAAEGHVSRAIRKYETLEASVLASGPAPAEDLRDAAGLSRLYGRLSALYRLAGNRSKAESMELQQLELWRHWDARLPQNAFVRRQLTAVRAHGQIEDLKSAPRGSSTVSSRSH